MAARASPMAVDFGVAMTAIPEAAQVALFAVSPGKPAMVRRMAIAATVVPGLLVPGLLVPWSPVRL